MFSKIIAPRSLWSLLLFFGINQVALAIGTYEIQPEKLLNNIESGKSGLIIDLRDKDKYQQSHIPTAIHIEHTQIENKILELLPRKQDTIILYCGDGTRSATAMIKLRKQGFKHLLNVHGNMHAWLRKKLPVTEQKAQ